MGLMLYEGEKGEIYVSSMKMFAKVMKKILEVMGELLSR